MNQFEQNVAGLGLEYNRHKEFILLRIMLEAAYLNL